ncbi:MAG: DUF1553 domain-containing protein [Planctomycetia bacterium]|nr:DUF1553 domain-containing protein [Planctomycetia bacterium]
MASLVLVVVFAALSSGVVAAEAVDYVRDVKPLLAKHCLACHSAVRQKSGFRIDTAAGVIGGGDSGPAVVPGRSADSPLMHAVLGTHDHSRMPPEAEGKALDESEVSILRSWIDAGAKAPAETPIADPRAHWAFQPVRRPAAAVDAKGWARNPIDTFVAAEQRRRGLAPAPEAAKQVLLRRLYLDLTGLAPTRQELQDFLHDDAPDAYEKVVDRLLARPQYGERWGRHWMDIWRYSDWAGWNKQIRDSQPHIWHWRDWIIEQLNADRPYDQMVTAMLAADELAPTDRNELRATGYLVRNFKLLSREQWLQDTVEHTFKSLLGLTLNCARCHDHMSDPIEQTEYYAFRAIFEPHQVRLDRLPGTADVAVDGLPRVFDKDLATATFLFVRGDERTPRKDKPIPPGVPALFGGKYEVSTVSLPREAYDPLRQAFVLQDDLAGALRMAEEAEKKVAALPTPTKAGDRKLAELEAASARQRYETLKLVIEVEQLEAAGKSNTEAWKKSATASTLAQRRQAVAEARVEVAKAENEVLAADEALSKAKPVVAGKPDKPASDVKRVEQAAKKKADTQKILKDAEAALALPESSAYAKRKLEVYPPQSSGRRSALARWVVDPKNPLTARVAVNHLWGRHFDRAIVATTANFGTLGAKPTHPELLDWLAAEFVDPQTTPSARPWSIKHLQRLIVTSSTYRQSSHAAATAVGGDPDNHYLTKFPARRLEAEVVRDCVLSCAGELDPTFGGPDIDHAQGLTTKRRSLYFRHAAEKQMTFLKLFDAAAVTECYERRESVMPQQALALANSELTLTQSRLLAGRLHAAHAADDGAFVVAAYETVVTRAPNEAEQAACREFLTQQQAWFAARQSPPPKPSPSPQLRAREMLVHALFNHHEFVTLP